jgi:hypothetical protein
MGEQTTVQFNALKRVKGKPEIYKISFKPKSGMPQVLPLGNPKFGYIKEIFSNEITDENNQNHYFYVLEQNWNKYGLG